MAGEGRGWCPRRVFASGRASAGRFWIALHFVASVRCTGVPVPTRVWRLSRQPRGQWLPLPRTRRGANDHRVVTVIVW